MGWKLAVSYSDLESTDMDMERLVRRQALDTFCITTPQQSSTKTSAIPLALSLPVAS